MRSIEDIRGALMSYHDYVQLGVSPPYVVEGSCDGGTLPSICTSSVLYQKAAHRQIRTERSAHPYLLISRSPNRV